MSAGVASEFHNSRDTHPVPGFLAYLRGFPIRGGVEWVHPRGSCSLAVKQRLRYLDNRLDDTRLLNMKLVI